MSSKKELLNQAFYLFRLGNKIHEKQKLLNLLYNPAATVQSPEFMKLYSELDNFLTEFVKLEQKHLEYRTSFNAQHKEVIV